MRTDYAPDRVTFPMNRKLLFILLLSFVAGIGLLHLITPVEMIYHHQTYRRLSYFPIVLGGMWFGVSGGLVLGLLSSIAFLPHVLLFAGEGISSYFSELSEIILYLAAGGLIGFIAGRERRLRERYQKLSIRLENSYAALAKGARQLVEAEEQLAATQKLSALGEMAATLAHEVKNPLASIKGTAEILLDDYPVGHKKREFVEILLKETARLTTTVEEVLGRTGEKITEPEQKVALAKLCKELRLQMGTQFERKGITFELQGMELADQVSVSASGMKQVLLNLLVNSCEALRSEPGRPGMIVLSVAEDDDCLRIMVDDNGPGIADVDLDDVFRPFFSTTQRGTGLGLSISRKIVESYGGSLRFCPGTLGGACIGIVLPKNHDRQLYESLIKSQ